MKLPPFFWWLIVATIMSGAIAILLAFTQPAAAHSSINPANNQTQAYDRECCSGSDCEAIPYEAVWETSKGWRVQYISKRGFAVDATVPRGKERNSSDGRMHACAVPGLLRCLYVARNV